jgi:hypothetical protein
MLDQTLKRFPAEIQSIESDVTAFERRHHSQRLRIVIKSTTGGETAVERALASVAERRVAEIMRKGQRFRQIFVEAERASERARNLRHFQRMREAGAEVVALMEDENLRLIGEPTKGR